MFKIIRNVVSSVLQKYDKNINNEQITIDKPKNPKLGDIYTNAAMVFAKQLKTTPQKLASDIITELDKQDYVKHAELAGAGFINITLQNSCWYKVINEILDKKSNYSFTDLKQNEKLNVEFVSANPTGPLHTGHARNAVFGSVAANLFEKIGYNVTREFYINDQGNQIKYLAQSVYLRYIELLGKEVNESQFSANMYCGEYVKDLAHKVFEQFGEKFLNKDEHEWLEPLCKFSIETVMQNIKNDLKSLGVIMNCYTSEAELCKRNLVEEALKILDKNGDIYEGILPKPKGTVNDEWEERPQTLFKSTKYGDDVDRAIKKSDGTWTYFAGDLAYHLDKFNRGFTKMLNVFGADHNGYVKRLKSAVNALSNGKAELEIRLYQLVNFLENGVPVRMSKRKGNFITLHDVVERVGKDVTRFMMISRHHDVMIDFDFVKAVEFSMDNPLFYIQYAHARICSVFRYFEKVFGTWSDDDLKFVDKSSIQDPTELEVLKLLSFWPDNIKSAALAIEPHRIPTYLRDISASFHALWNKGKINDELRFIVLNDKQKSLAKLSLLRAVQLVLVDGLTILGITPVEEMK